MNHLDAPTVIRTKRDGGRLSDAAIDWIIDAYTDGQVADEQMSALLMAICFNGLNAVSCLDYRIAIHSHSPF